MKIALIGLGNMGLPMAANLLKAGHSVAGYDLVRAALDAHAASGGAVAGVDRRSRRRRRGRHHHAARGQARRRGVPRRRWRAGVGGREKPLLIDSSTIDVVTARRVAAEAAKAGMEMLDAPVSGGVGGATAGTLTFMCGGTEAGFARAKPVLQAWARTSSTPARPAPGRR